MPKIAIAEKKLRTKQLAQLIASGVEPEEAATQLGAKYGWGRHSRRRYIDRVFAAWNRDKKLNREAQLSRALATRDTILRQAMARTRTVVRDVQNQKTGDWERRRIEESDPDLQAALAAADSKARLLGLLTPDKIDLFVEGLGPVLSDMVDVLREDISDAALLARVVRRLRERIETGNAPARTATIEGKVEDSRALPMPSTPAT